MSFCTFAIFLKANIITPRKKDEERGFKVAKQKDVQPDGQITIDELEKTIQYDEVNVTKGSNVVQSNFLIENKPKMTLDELKMFSTLIATINKEDQDFRKIKLKVTDVIDLWEIPQKNAYRQVKNALAGLLDKKFALERVREDGKLEIEMATYISKFTYVEGDGYATVVVDPMFKPFLLDLREKFTLYGIDDVLKLESSTAIRTYELLKQYEVLGQRSFTVGDYKKKVGIEGKYKGNNSNLKKYVLDRVCEELSSKTSLLTRYDLTGRGEKAVITFVIYKKEAVTSKKAEDKNFGAAEKEILLQLLKDELDMDTVFPDERIKRAVNIATEGLHDRKEIMGRYKVLKDAFLEFEDRRLVTEIKNDWAYFKKVLESKLEFM